MGPPISPPQVDLLDQVFALGIVKDWSIAIDGGANVGDWTAKMRKRFDTVFAVEPAIECVAFLQARFSDYPGVRIWHCALWDVLTWGNVVSPNKKPTCQKRYMKLDRNGDTPVLTIDSMDLPTCGLIKLDLEGAEFQALTGAVETIKRCKPVLIVEFFNLSKRFGRSESDVLRLITDMGYHQVLVSFPDRVFTQ